MADQNTQTPVPPPASGSVDNDTLMGILSYLGVLVLIPIFATSNRSSFLTHHINQGVNLLIVAVIGAVAFPLVHLWMVSPIWNLLMLVLMVIGIINVSKKETKSLPVIGNLFHLVK